MAEDKEEQAPERPRDEEADVITRETPVGQALGRLGIGPCIVGEDDTLTEVTEALAAKPGTHTAAVVDDEGHLVGIIPMGLLLSELFLYVAPEEFLVGMREMEDIEKFGKISKARTAKELMQPAVCVSMADSVREAFARMHENKLEGVPIVDESEKVVGYLDRLQLMRLWLQTHQEEIPEQGDPGEAIE